MRPLRAVDECQGILAILYDELRKCGVLFPRKQRVQLDRVADKLQMFAAPAPPTSLDNVLDSKYTFPAGCQWIRLNVNFALAGSEW